MGVIGGLKEIVAVLISFFVLNEAMTVAQVELGLGLRFELGYERHTSMDLY